MQTGELLASDREVTISRIVDRALRPQFISGYQHDTQIVCSLMSADGTRDPGVQAVNGASAALLLSDIPWNGPVGE